MAAGLTRLGPLDVVGYAEQRLDDFARLPARDPRALSPEAATRVTDFLPQLARDCEDLASVGLPLTLQHNDLHQHNVFDVGGELRFFDFGDALLSDPLAALWVPLAGLAHRLGCSVGDPRVQRVANAAVEHWTDVATSKELRAVLPAALLLGRLGRCESWIRCLASMNESELGEYGDAAAYWLEAVATVEP
jgi:Ser/Thr protein kinase RdoA (MazF antagonist)